MVQRHPGFGPSKLLKPPGTDEPPMSPGYRCEEEARVPQLVCPGALGPVRGKTSFRTGMDGFSKCEQEGGFPTLR